VSEKKSLELRVSVDVGSRRHSVAIGLPNGEVLEEFEISHRVEGFQEFFSRTRSTRGKGVVQWRWRWKGTTAGPGR
jgi:hypothetical protein